jgi:hypothetical protein
VPQRPVTVQLRLPRALADRDHRLRQRRAGARSDDLGYALFLWLNLGTDGAPAHEQARRITVFCDAYGIAKDINIVETIANATSRNIQRLREQSRLADVRWWQAQLHWVERNRAELTLG